MKYLVVIGDGMADFALAELGGRTPLMAARKPHIDRISREGFCGQVMTVPPGYLPAATSPACRSSAMTREKYYTGRAPIEAYGMGIALEEGDVAFRCNLVCLDVRGPKVFMGDYSAGQITIRGGEGPDRGLRRLLSGARNSGFIAGVGYRHLMVWKGGLADMATTPPHDILDKEVIDHMPAGIGSQPIIKLMSDSQIFLKCASGQQGPDKPGGLCRQTASGSGARAESLTFPPSARNTGPTGRWWPRSTW